MREIIGIAVDLGRIICTQDPEAAASRDAKFLAREQRTLVAPPLPGIVPGVRQEEGTLPGRAGLQARVRRDGATPSRLDDAFGPGFGLIVRGSEARLGRRAWNVLDLVGGYVFHVEPAADVDGAYAAWLDRHDCDAVLVRPDHLVFGVARGADAGSRLLEELDAHLREAGSDVQGDGR